MKYVRLAQIAASDPPFIDRHQHWRSRREIEGYVVVNCSSWRIRRELSGARALGAAVSNILVVHAN